MLNKYTKIDSNKTKQYLVTFIYLFKPKGKEIPLTNLYILKNMFHVKFT